jgi:thioredoxin reductase
MTVTVDVVVIGGNHDALAAAAESARGGKRVLVITAMRGAELRRRIRQARALAGDAAARITVLAGADVECIAGIRTVEAVLARDMRTGRRVDVNTAALLTFTDEHIEAAGQQKE